MYACVHVHLCTYVRAWVYGGGSGGNVGIHKKV